MTERLDLGRKRQIKDYRIIFKALPELKRLALDYWEQAINLSPDGPLIIEDENIIFSNTVLEMANILLDNDNFQAAISRVGVNPEENAIIESILMIETVLDIEEESNNKI